MKTYLFPFDRVTKGSRVVVYGAGRVGKEIIKQAVELSYCDIVICDRNFLQIKAICGITVNDPQTIDFDTVDYVIAAVTIQQTASVVRDIERFGVEKSKIVIGICVFDSAPEELINLSDASPWGRLSFSYHCEDLFVLFTFKALGIEKPSYIDIGAFSPYDGSNTAHMYRSGSRGINVEANPQLVAAFHTERPEDVTLNVACGMQAGTLPLYVVRDLPGLTTLSHEVADNVAKELSLEVDTIEVPVRTVDSIIDEYCDGNYPDYLDCDIEGLDFDVLSTCHFSELSPKIICVEAGKGKGSLENMSAMLDEKGFELYAVLSDDLIFLRKGLKSQLKVTL